MESITAEPLTLNEIAELLKGGESERLEFKGKLPDGDDIAATLAAFTNGEGGVLLVGIDDTGRPVGVDAPDATAQRLANLARDACRPPVVTQVGQVAFGPSTSYGLAWLVVQD